MNFQKLRDFLDYFVPTLGVPGTDTAVFKDHEEIFRYSSGYDSICDKTPVRRDAIYNIYSATKVATAVAVAQLIERGEILMTDPLYAYFPEYRHMKVKTVTGDGNFTLTDAKSPILISNLLNMTSGFDYNLQCDAIQRVKRETGGRCPTLDVIRALADEPLQFEPGENFMYGLSIDILGGLVELVSGMKLSAYMKENIFDPLGMKDTRFGCPPDKLDRLATQYKYDTATKSAIEIGKTENDFNLGYEYESGGAGLTSTVDDYILLADMLANRGAAKNGNQILSSYTVDMMRQNTLSGKALETFRCIPQVSGYGYSFAMRVNMAPSLVGNLAPVGEFGWDGMRLCYLSADAENRLAVFMACYVNGPHPVLHPRLRNIIYGCLDAE